MAKTEPKPKDLPPEEELRLLQAVLDWVEWSNEILLDKLKDVDDDWATE